MSFDKVQEGHNVTVTTKPYTGIVRVVNKTGSSSINRRYSIVVDGPDGHRSFSSDLSEITINKPLPYKNGSVILVTGDSFGVAPGYYHLLGGGWFNERCGSIHKSTFEGSDWVEVDLSAGHN